jgi:hypothetical protein
MTRRHVYQVCGHPHRMPNGQPLETTRIDATMCCGFDVRHFLPPFDQLDDMQTPGQSGSRSESVCELRCHPREQSYEPSVAVEFQMAVEVQCPS